MYWTESEVNYQLLWASRKRRRKTCRDTLMDLLQCTLWTNRFLLCVGKIRNWRCWGTVKTLLSFSFGHFNEGKSLKINQCVQWLWTVYVNTAVPVLIFFSPLTGQNCSIIHISAITCAAIPQVLPNNYQHVFNVPINETCSWFHGVIHVILMAHTDERPVRHRSIKTLVFYEEKKYSGDTLYV